MKKLIVATVAIAMAVVANAATAKWATTYEVANGTDTGITSATVAYLIDADVLSQSAIYEAIAGGATLDAAIGDNALKSLSMTDGKVATTSFDLPSSYTAGNTINAYMVLFDNDLNAVYFSEELSKAIPSAKDAALAFTSDSSMDGIMADMSGFD